MNDACVHMFYVCIHTYFISRIRRNLFIHKSTILCKRISSSIYQILKIPPPFASSDVYPASGIRYESVAREFSEPLPHSYSLATARRRVHFSSRFLISLLPFILIYRHIHI